MGFVKTMGKGTYSRLFGGGDKDLQKKAADLLMQLGKALQSASAKMHVGAKAWLKGDIETLKEIRDEVVKLERESDSIKDEFVDSVFSKHAYMPQQSQERYQLVVHMDSIIDAAEEAVRVLALGYKNKPLEVIVEMAEKSWMCTDLLQDAIKYLFTDFEEALKYARKVSVVREDARDLKFQLHKKVFRGKEFDPAEGLFYHVISRRITEVAIQAELTADFIRTIVIRYS
jgi:predicted phosphate transport protein (TIGR00153 family)